MLYIAENNLGVFTVIVDLDESIEQDEFFDMLAEAIGPDVDLISNILYESNVITREEFESDVVEFHEVESSSDLDVHTMTFDQYVEMWREEISLHRDHYLLMARASGE